MKRELHRGWAPPIALAGVLALAVAGQASVPTTEIIQDTFTNASSQHATAVEPDTFAFGSTIVAASQVGRFFNGGASDIGVATSTDGGTTWSQADLPGITTHSGTGTFDRVSDPAVAYDPEHNVWMVSTIPLTASVDVPAVFVSRSTDGGLTWGTPITVAAAGPGQDFDKNWIVCDTHAASPFYGNCYTTWDDFGDGDRLYTSTSTDGGLTWGTPMQTGNAATGLGGQPVVQPNGTVIVPASNAFETSILAYRSTDGGTTWSNSVTVSTVTDHRVSGSLRSGPLPSAEVDGAGNVYVVWHDCRFRKGCKTNDIVMSTSTDGLTWTTVARVPIDATTSGIDHFIPGIGVDPGTSGTSARLGLTYYFYRNSRCAGKGKPCQLEVGYIQSNDGGSTWSNPTDVAGPFPVTWVADTSQGRMVGDYISTSWVNGKAFGAFAVALQAPTPFEESIYVPTGGLTAAAGGFVNTSQGERAVPNAASDHAAARSAIRRR